MPDPTRNLIIVGDGEFAEIAYEYFTHDSHYTVCGFAVEREYLKRDRFLGLPVVALEEIETHFPPARYQVHVAITYTQLNRVRKRLYLAAKAKGYDCANYVSSRAFVWRTAELGENVFIFENNVVQHGCKVGNNVVLWSGNHIGHQTVIQDHTYIASHVVISGYCDIGEACFVGVNATFADRVTIGQDCFIAMGCGVTKDLKGGLLYKGMPATPAKVTAKQYLKVEE